MDVGLLGSSDAIQIDVVPGESCSGDNATTCNIIIKIGSETFQFNESGGDATSQRSSEGPVVISAEGVGDYTISVSVASVTIGGSSGYLRTLPCNLGRMAQTPMILSDYIAKVYH